MILTTQEAAEELGVSDARVRQLVAAGDLVPLNPGRSDGYRFTLLDVADLQVRRRSLRETRRLDTLSRLLVTVS